MRFHCIDHLVQSPGKKYTGAPGDFTPEMQKRAPENCHRLQGKSLFIVADLVNGMWKVAPENKNFIFGLPVSDTIFHVAYSMHHHIPWISSQGFDEEEDEGDIESEEESEEAEDPEAEEMNDYEPESPEEVSILMNEFHQDGCN